MNDQFASREQQIVECLARGGAADDADCKAYASRTVDQFGEAQRKRCGDNFSGAGWSGDANDAYRWCRQHSHDERDAALSNRDQALRGCNQIEIDLGKVFKFKF